MLLSCSRALRGPRAVVSTSQVIGVEQEDQPAPSNLGSASVKIEVKDVSAAPTGAVMMLPVRPAATATARVHRRGGREITATTPSHVRTSDFFSAHDRS